MKVRDLGKVKTEIVIESGKGRQKCSVAIVRIQIRMATVNL